MQVGSREVCPARTTEAYYNLGLSGPGRFTVNIPRMTDRFPRAPRIVNRRVQLITGGKPESAVGGSVAVQ